MSHMTLSSASYIYIDLSVYYHENIAEVGDEEGGPADNINNQDDQHSLGSVDVLSQVISMQVDR